MIGRLIERLFVSVRADMSDLSRDLNEGVAKTGRATKQMSKSWAQVSAHVDQLTQELLSGKIAQNQYLGSMNRLASSTRELAGSYKLAQREVWGYAKAARAAAIQQADVWNHAPAIAWNRSVGQARMQMLNLGYQINDVGMTLASGMNPLTVLIQQGSQMVQIYAGQGGVTAAFTDLSRILIGVSRNLWPILALAAAFKGLQHEINQTTDLVEVSFMDTFRAVFQVLFSYIQGPVAKAFDFMRKAWQTVWDQIVGITVAVGNTIIKTIQIIVAGIQSAIENLPSIFYAAFNRAVARALEALFWFGVEFENMMGGIASTMNQVFGTSLNEGPLYDWVNSLDIQLQRAEQRANEASSKITNSLGDRVQEILDSNPMGDLFEKIQTQAVENSLGRMGDEVEELGSSAKEASKEVEELVNRLQEQLGTAAENVSQVFGNAFESLAQTGRLTFSSFVQDLNQLIIQSTSKILQRELANMLSVSVGSIGSSSSNIFTSLFGGGLPGRARGGVEMPWRSFIAGEEGAELITQDGPSGARRVRTAGQTRHMMSGSSRSNVNVTMIINTPDVDSFRKSQTQLASRMGQYISKGERNR